VGRQRRARRRGGAQLVSAQRAKAESAESAAELDAESEVGKVGRAGLRLRGSGSFGDGSACCGGACPEAVRDEFGIRQVPLQRSHFSHEEGFYLHTVGGGLVLLSDSSMLCCILFCSCSSRNARSSLIFMIPRSMRVLRTRRESFVSSISLMRRLRAIHFEWYAASTEGGRWCGWLSPLEASTER